jgi:hypothetical protein
MLSFKQFLLEEPEIIFEAVGKTTLATEYFKEYISRLRIEHGIKGLGEGAYGKVFQHPEFNNVVAKVFHNDPAYESYLRWVIKNQNNKYVPQVIEVHYFKTPETTQQVKDHRGRLVKRTSMEERIGVVFMKKLERMGNREVSKIAKTFAALIGGGIVEYDKGFEDFLAKDWGKLAAATQTSDPDFSALAKWLERNHASDIHNGNVMKDENGNIIFTDPVA